MNTQNKNQKKPDSPLQFIWSVIQKYKKSSILIIGLILALAILLVALFWFLSSFVGGVRMGDTLMSSSYDSSSFESSSSPAPDFAEESSGAVGIEIQEGNINIKTEDTDRDEAIIRSEVDLLSGYIEEHSKSETNTLLRSRLQIRVPKDNFESLIEVIKQKLDVRTHNISNYRIDIEERATELDIVRETLRLYGEMKVDAQNLPLEEGRVEITMDITERELGLKQRERRLEQQIQNVVRRGDMSTVTLVLEERLDGRILPEDIGSEFKNGINNTLEAIVTILIALITTSFVIFFSVIQWIVYALIVIILLWLAFRMVRRMYKRFYS